jgi:glycosyltransferase involved in cell wall biosynthesis
MNKVSVVIPCYNSGEFLDEAVQSALAQTWPNLEVVIVDDGSTDQSTLRLLEEARWPRTRIFRQANAGPAAARNHAVREASGSYILPLDADDTIEPTYVEKAAAVLEARPDVGCVYCKARKFGAERGPWNLPVYTLRELVIDNVIFVTSLYRKEDWESVGGYNEKLRHGVEDYDFWVKIVHLGRDVVQLEDSLFNYRIQETSRTTSFQEGRANVVKTYAEIFRSNIGFYAEHADMLFEHRFGLYDELQYWRSRYSRLDTFLNGHPRLLRFLCAIKRRLSRYVSRKRG